MMPSLAVNRTAQKQKNAPRNALTSEASPSDQESRVGIVACPLLPSLPAHYRRAVEAAASAEPKREPPYSLEAAPHPLVSASLVQQAGVAPPPAASPPGTNAGASYELRLQVTAATAEEAQAQGAIIAAAVAASAGVDVSLVEVTVVAAKAGGRRRLRATSAYDVIVRIFGDVARLSAFFADPTNQAAVLKALADAGIAVVPGSLRFDTGDKGAGVEGGRSDSSWIGIPIGVSLGVALLGCIAHRAYKRRACGPHFMPRVAALDPDPDMFCTLSYSNAKSTARHRFWAKQTR
jgi:hypothetical protein